MSICQSIDERKGSPDKTISWTLPDKTISCSSGKSRTTGNPHPHRQRAEEKTPFFFEFSLCLSRACLGKIMLFIYKWLKSAVFSPPSTEPTQSSAVCSKNNNINNPSCFVWRVFLAARVSRACLGMINRACFQRKATQKEIRKKRPGRGAFHDSNVSFFSRFSFFFSFFLILLTCTPSARRSRPCGARKAPGATLRPA
jgi:hypothetical protein